MQIIIFLFMNLFVIMSSFLLAFKIFELNIIDSLICFFLLYFSQIIFSELVLGILGALYLNNIILLNLGIFLIIFLITRKRPSNFPQHNRIRDLIFELFNDRIILFAIAIILGFLMVKVFINLINPPFGWDSLNYHFTFPVEWMKNGRFNNPIVVSDDPFPTYYPINGSLLFFWFLLPFKSAFLADLGQLPFFIISFLSVFSICRKLEIDKQSSFLAASLFVMIPNFFKQLQIGYVDIMVGGIFLAALNYIFTLKEIFNIKNMIIFAVSFGILVGIKSTALPFSIFILAPFLYLLFLQNKITIKIKIGFIMLFISVALFFGGFSYFKNIILTGNPFYPLDATISGKTILKGVIDKATFTYRNVKGGNSLPKLLFHEGLGVQSLLIILPGSLLAPFVSIFKNRNKDLFSNYIMFLPILLYLAYRFIIPIPNSRYLYPMLGTGLPVAFYAIHFSKISFKIMRLAGIVFILSSAFECARNIELVISVILTGLLIAAFMHILKYKSSIFVKFSRNVLISGAVISVIILQLLSLDYKKNEYARYVKNSRYWPDATRAWAWLNNNTQGNNIAYVGRPLPYPLYGTDFKNNVYYVSVNSIDPIHLHDLRGSRYSWDNPENMHKSFELANNYRGNADYSTWISNLRKRKAGFLFIYSLHHTKNIEFPIEELWAKIHHDKFNLVFSNETARIYRIST